MNPLERNGLMNDMKKVDRNLWIITGATSFPFVVLAFAESANMVVPHIYFLMAFAGIFNGFIVPFVLMRTESNWVNKTIAIGGNLVISAFWIDFTGQADSIFFPVFYLLPIVAATMYGGFIDSILAATVSTILSFWVLIQEHGMTVAVLQETHVLAMVVLFFLVASILGYLIKIQREQFIRNQKMNEELEIAYNQLSASHDQLQSYTGIIEKMNREMEQLAITDELTMLYNYRYFQITMDKELKRNRYSFLSLIMMDIDDFKSYNDEHGHMAGDMMLKEIAKVMKDTVRDVDTLVRYGGEEFAVIMPSTDIEEARQVSERIRRFVENLVVVTPEGKSSSVTISSGIACYPKDAKTKSELISHADLALFQAKLTGRNRTEVYTPEAELMPREEQLV